MKFLFPVYKETTYMHKIGIATIYLYKNAKIQNLQKYMRNTELHGGVIV